MESRSRQGRLSFGDHRAVIPKKIHFAL